MEDYPRTILELERRFSTDDACREYLELLRWPDGFVCPGCRVGEAWAMKDGLWLCRGCRRQVSVTAGTIFHRTRLPLTLWFRAIWYVTSQKNGTSAMGVQRVLGLGSYHTAWTWFDAQSGRWGDWVCGEQGNVLRSPVVNPQVFTQSEGAQQWKHHPMFERVSTSHPGESSREFSCEVGTLRH